MGGCWVVGVLDETKAILSPAGAWLWAELGNTLLYYYMICIEDSYGDTLLCVCYSGVDTLICIGDSCVDTLICVGHSGVNTVLCVGDI